MHSARVQFCARSCYAKVDPTFKNESIRMFSSKNYVTLTRRQLKRYCDVLGVPVTASEPKIKQAFYKKSLQHHPDRNKGLGSQQAFTEVSEAYQAILTYKRSGNDESKSQQTWRRTSDMGGFRPWIKVPEKERQQQQPFTTSSVELDEHIAEHHTVGDAALRNDSSAGGWCTEFYIGQMEKDFQQHLEKKLKNKKKLENETGCVVM